MKNKITAHRLPVTRTAHYYSLGEGGAATERFWFVCHGYGQSAARFIQKFSGIAGPKDYVVAPEGLSRFYWGGLDGPVVASWMTRGDRLDEIADFSQMLSAIYREQLDQLPSAVEIILFGFSQGCATQLRWMLRDHPRFDRLVLWAGRIPEDLEYGSHREYFAGKPVDLFFGDDDPLMSEALFEESRSIIGANEWKVEWHTYAGDHRVVREALESYADVTRKGREGAEDEEAG